MQCFHNNPSCDGPFGPSACEPCRRAIFNGMTALATRFAQSLAITKTLSQTLHAWRAELDGEVPDKEEWARFLKQLILLSVAFLDGDESICESVNETIGFPMISGIRTGTADEMPDIIAETRAAAKSYRKGEEWKVVKPEDDQ